VPCAGTRPTGASYTVRVNTWRRRLRMYVTYLCDRR
jgi:hypothetical protein